MKRILSLLLALILALSLAPVAELEAKAEETDIYTLVEQQIKAYAKSIDQTNAAKTAATATTQIMWKPCPMITVTRW